MRWMDKSKDYRKSESHVPESSVKLCPSSRSVAWCRPSIMEKSSESEESSPAGS